MSDFFDYLQSLAGNKKISIKKFDDKFAIQYMTKNINNNFIYH